MPTYKYEKVASVMKGVQKKSIAITVNIMIL